MSINQLNFAPNLGTEKITIQTLNLIETSIKRLQNFEPKEGYFFADSGGKDSEATRKLLILSGCRYDSNFNRTGVDPPELIYHIRTNHPETIFLRPQITMWQGIMTKGLPRRNARWCCEKLKEHSGSGRVVVTGIRWQESARRASRHMVEVSPWDRSKRFLHPIIDWTSKNVWEFLREYSVEYCRLYDEGSTGRYRGNGQFKRLGCVLCPMSSKGQVARDMARWPKIAMAWEHAALRYYERQTEGVKKYKNFEQFWHWWLSRKGQGQVEDCLQGRLI